MGKKLDLNYFYGHEADQFNFIRIPKPLLFDPMYKDIKLEEALTYSMLLDRMSLSIKNSWFDELGRAYVYCSIETIMEYAGCGKNKAVGILKNLDEIGLIEKVLIPGRGLKIYVKNFIPKEYQKFENQTLSDSQKELSVEYGEDEEDEETYVAVYNSNDAVYKSNREVSNLNHPSPDSKPAPVYFSNPNNNKNNNTDYNNNKSIHIISRSDTAADEIADEMGYAQQIKDNIELDTLLERYPTEREFITGLYDLIIETVLCRADEILIASNKYSANFVRGKLLKLNFFHIQYVMDCWARNTDKPRNVKKYLLASLFNAVSTMDAFYTAEVNHDMANGLVKEG